MKFQQIFISILFTASLLSASAQNLSLPGTVEQEKSKTAGDYSHHTNDAIATGRSAQNRQSLAAGQSAHGSNFTQQKHMSKYQSNDDAPNEQNDENDGKGPANLSEKDIAEVMHEPIERVEIARFIKTSLTAAKAGFSQRLDQEEAAKAIFTSLLGAYIRKLYSTELAEEKIIITSEVIEKVAHEIWLNKEIYYTSGCTESTCTIL